MDVALKALVWMFVAIFGITGIVTLGGLTLPNIVKIPQKYLGWLVAALLVETAAASITLVKDSLGSLVTTVEDAAETLESTSRLFAQQGGDGWTKVLRIDGVSKWRNHEHPEWRRIATYVNDPNSAMKLIRSKDLQAVLNSQIRSQPATLHPPIRRISPADASRRSQIETISVLRGLHALILIVSIDGERIDTKYAVDHLIVSDDTQHGKLPGVVFVWPLDDVSDEVIASNPIVSIRFNFRGGSE